MTGQTRSLFFKIPTDVNSDPPMRTFKQSKASQSGFVLFLASIEKNLCCTESENSFYSKRIDHKHMCKRTKLQRAFSAELFDLSSSAVQERKQQNN